MPPTAAPASVADLCRSIIRSRLLGPEEVKAIYERWQDEAGPEKIEKLDSFGRWLARQRLLSEYQVALLLRGHTEGFFLNDLKIVDRLGRGRTAGVYRAVEPSGRTVAIKVLPSSRAKEPNILARFQREARLATQLSHPNVVRSFDTGEAKGVHYLVMEFLDGETVAEALEKRGRLTVPESVRIVHQTLEGLCEIHAKGMIHRDLKPANLMLIPAPGPGEDTRRCTVKVLDIGLGRALFDEAVEADQLTREGVMLGTPDYLAPEQARDAKTADIRADIYSLGCVLYHLISGQTPFPDTNVINLAMRHAREVPRPLRELVPEVPGELQQVLDWMMAKDPAQRYPTPERAAEALKKFLAPAGAEGRTAVPDYLGSLGRAEGVPVPEEVPVGKLKPKKPGTATAPAARIEDSAEVELVPIPPPPEELEASRPLTELTRRDALMIGFGSGGVLAAIITGYALSRLMRRDTPE